LIDYKKSGVDIQAGDDLVSWLQEENAVTPSEKNLQKKSNLSPLRVKSDIPDFKSRVFSGIGGFAALFDGRFQHMTKPLLISCTDGVGTKVKLASYFNDFSTVGQDLVGMCVNDLICTGGTPLFFLDYYAVGKLKMESAQSFLTGVKQACEKSHLALIGGETAEMPGVYQVDDFDCAGFSVGVVDQDKMWGAHKVEAGDLLIGLKSSGFHSNGYSLIRKIFEGEYEKYRQWLMEPTRLYVEATLSLKDDAGIKAAAHMTGGGIENLPRVMPDQLKALVKKWELPDCFKEVQARAKLSDADMRTTFNCGIGLMLIISPTSLANVKQKLTELNYEFFELGEIQNRKDGESHVVWDQ
jgi:phosphoribosylformylglycinamidine cyclo-ligase